ncbi:MAG: DNA recombination protein RmuC [Pseudomonadota bacterium]
MDPYNLAFVVAGAALGVLALVMALFVVRASGEAKALREALDAARDEHDDDRLELTRAHERLERLGVVEGELASVRAELRQAEARLARQDQEIKDRNRALEEERARLGQIGDELQQKFKLLANEALTASQKQLIERAEHTFKQQQKDAEGGVKSLVDPIRERLEAFKTQVETIEKERLTHRTELGEQIRTLSQGLETQRSQTSKLVNALQRSSTTRGQWGERTVENILELAGLTKGIDYESQHQTRDAEGAALRPDFVVRLPGGGRFVIDSKVALTAYLDAVEAPDEAERKKAMGRHAQQVRTHIKQLARKEYAGAVEGAVDFVALFIPGESFYSAAMEEDPNLFDEAIKANVIITTPATLLALAKAVAYGFRQEKLETNAVKIAAIGSELHDRLATFAEHLGRVGSGLRTATGNYNKAVASLEGRVLVSARRMAELNGQASQKALQAPDQVDETPRALAGPEED